MKTKVTQNREFSPIKIEIVLETEKEAKTIRDVVGQTSGQAGLLLQSLYDALHDLL